MKQIIVLKDSKTDIHLEQDYMVIKKTQCSDSIIAYRHIKRVYINKLIHLSISECLKLALHFDVYIINQHGNILAKVQLHEEI